MKKQQRVAGNGDSERTPAQAEQHSAAINRLIAEHRDALPLGVHFNGRMEMIGRALLLFTDLAEASPSHGATFALLEADATAEALSTKLASKRAEFAAARRGGPLK